LIFSSNTIIVVLPISGVTAIIKVYYGTTTATLNKGRAVHVGELGIDVITMPLRGHRNLCQ